MCLIKATVFLTFFFFVKDSSYFGVRGVFVMQAITPYHGDVHIPSSFQTKSMIWLKVGTNVQMGKAVILFKSSG